MDNNSAEPSPSHGEDDGDMITRHSQERKELQARIMTMKRAVPKNNKKGRSQLALEVAALENELESRHEMELLMIQDSASKAASVGPHTNISDHFTEKKSRTAKRRERQREAEKSREERIASQEKVDQFGDRAVEMNELRKQLSQLGLGLYEVPADGDCLYSALAHQLGGNHTVSTLRSAAARNMRENKDEFQPFLTNESGDPVTDSEFEDYCDRVENTTSWGGQLEIRAISDSIRRAIRVVQAVGSNILIGEDYLDSTSASYLNIIYHRHVFSLGQHYNSAIALPSEL